MTKNKAYHLRNDQNYHRLRTKLGRDKFHIYNVIPEDSSRERVAGLVNTLQRFVWQGLLAVSKRTSPVHVRGEKRWLKTYYFL